MKKQESAVKQPVQAKKQEEKKMNGKEFTGKVVSAKSKDTIVVVVERFVQHPVYKKPLRRTNRLAVHAPDATVKVGQVVTIKEIRPVSKTKHFMLIK